VAPHRGHDERIRAALPDVPDELLHQDREVVDSATAGGNGDSRMRFDDSVQLGQLRPQRAAWVVEAGAFEPLPNFDKELPLHFAAQV
jgi:hypothetical protein